MRRHDRATATFLVLCLGVVSAGTSALAQSPAPGLPRSNVSELITFVPPATSSVGFTDWGRIKVSQDANGVTGASPIDDKMPVVMSTNAHEAAASGYGIAHLRDMYDTWSWDALDLDWEATIQGDGPPLFVLRFRDGVDLAPIAARLDERGFSTTTVPGATIRSHEMVLGEDWLTAGEFAVLNTAFLEDDRTLVLSVDPDQVRDVAVNHGSYPAFAALDAAATELDGASAAFLATGLDTCVGFTALPFDIGEPLASPDTSFPTAGLHPYAVLGVGYGRPDWDPVGRIVFGYLDEATAAADLAGRLELAQSGISQRFEQPYADSAFEVTDSHVDGANLTLDVAPIDDRPRRLLDMVYARDMTFAGC